MTDARVTQETARVVEATDPDARVTQETTRAVTETEAAARATQETARAVVESDPDARLTQETARVVVVIPPPARLTQETVRAVFEMVPEAMATQASVRAIWRPFTNPTPPTADLSGSGYAWLTVVTDYLVTPGGATLVADDWTTVIVDGLGNELVTGRTDMAFVVDGAGAFLTSAPHWT